MMEKAIVKTRKSKKDKLIVEIIIGNKHLMAIQEKFIVDESMNSKECEVERNNGQIKKVIIEGKELEKKNNPNKNSKRPYNQINSRYNHNNNKLNSSQNNSDPARAPYNFIPLNKKIVTQDKPKDFDRYEGNTGYIDLEIEAKTPIYIGGTKKKDDKENPDFYKQAGKYRIPGSSLRGMMRIMVEITGWSKFYFFNDDYLYYRAGKDETLENEYKKYMTSSDNKNRNSQYKMNSGLLYKDGLKYFIIPANKQFEPIPKKDVNEEQKIGQPLYKKDKKDKKDNRGNKYQLYAIEYNQQHCYLVVSGNMPNKKHDWLVYADPNDCAQAIPLRSDNIESYTNDKNRKSINLIEALKKPKFVPCFYVEWQDKDNNKRISFGHTPLFRISYKKSVGEHITQEEVTEFDIAESIFGNTEAFMTRVFFEDAFLTEDSLDKVTKETKIPKILSAPKPTSFQLYLEQKGVVSVKDLKHYNSDTQIRGHKLYWHQQGDHWEETNSSNTEKYSSQYTKIKPINTGAKFRGRIRFENLSDIELGALLFAVDLPQNLAHKIGMAKPLGLGSIRICSKLYLSDRVNRYKNLFAEWNGIVDENDKKEEFKREFEKYILSAIGEQKNSLWETNRLKELKRMLDFEHKPNADNIKYMNLDDFKKRQILPHPTSLK